MNANDNMKNKNAFISAISRRKKINIKINLQILMADVIVKLFHVLRVSICNIYVNICKLICLTIKDTV